MPQKDFCCVPLCSMLSLWQLTDTYVMDVAPKIKLISSMQWLLRELTCTIVCQKHFTQTKKLEQHTNSNRRERLNICCPRVTGSKWEGWLWSWRRRSSLRRCSMTKITRRNRLSSSPSTKLRIIVVGFSLHIASLMIDKQIHVDRQTDKQIHVGRQTY